MKIIRLISAAVFLLVCGFLIGYWQGKQYSQNPTIHVYRKQRLVVESGDAICPENHTCTWKAWDLQDNKEVPPQNYYKSNE